MLCSCRKRSIQFQINCFQKYWSPRIISNLKWPLVGSNIDPKTIIRTVLLEVYYTKWHNNINIFFYIHCMSMENKRVPEERPIETVNLPPVQSQANLYIHAVWPGSILLADQFQVLILISLIMIMHSSKIGRWCTFVFHLRNSAG